MLVFQAHTDFSISQLGLSKPGMGTEVSSGQETSHKHPSGMSHPSGGLHCWELGMGSPWERCVPSLLGEKVTSQSPACWEVDQQVPEGPIPAAFLCFNGHRAGNTDGQRNPGSQKSHPFPPQLLLHTSTDDWRMFWSEPVPSGTKHSLCAPQLQLQEQEGAWELGANTGTCVTGQIPSHQCKLPLKTRHHALFSKRRKLPSVWCELLGLILGRRGGLSPLKSGCVAGGMGRQAGWVVPPSQAREEPWESFSLPSSGRQQQGTGCLQAAFGFRFLVGVQS